MTSTVPTRVVLVTRATEYQQLIAQHGTRKQAKFFLESRDQTIAIIEDRHHEFESALQTVVHSVPSEWRRTRVDRGDLDRFLFAPQDIIVVIGQDGLVANTAKYLTGQPVIGINPSPDRHEGILVPHPPSAILKLLPSAVNGEGRFEKRTMVEAVRDDG